MADIVPRSFWSLPSLRPAFWEDEDELITSGPSGVSISEDEKNVFVEAALPGVNPEDIEVTLDKGMLWIKGEVKQEEKNKKYYRKATGSYSYRIAVPGELDQNVEPEASVKNGIMTVAFAKSPKSQPKKIAIKSGK